MPRIHFISPDGSKCDIFTESGLSVMEVAKAHGVSGMHAECGGAISCGKCHVYVGAEFADMIGPADDFEAEMLEDVGAAIRPCSRLACQITILDEFDGSLFEIAPV